MTFIAIIFSVPLTQRTGLNTDLGADSCGFHILENGSIEPEEKDYLHAYGGKYEIYVLQTYNTLSITQVLFTSSNYMC